MTQNVAVGGAVHPAAKRFHMVFFCVGFFFLLNSNVMIADVLPDAIGYLFMLVPLYFLSDLHTRFESAARLCLLLAVLTFVKIPISFFAIFVGSVDPTMVLLLTFVFSLFELPLSIFFFRNLMDGIEYIAVRAENSYSYKNTDLLRRLTYVFFTVKILLALLPEFIPMISDPTSAFITEDSLFYQLSDFMPYIIVIFAVIVLCLGIGWYSIVYPFFRNLTRDSSLMEEFAARYERAHAEDRAMKVRKDMSVISWLLIISAPFALPIVLDSFDAVPMFISAILIGLMCFFAKKYDKRFRAVLIASGAVTVVNIAIYVVLQLFSGVYNTDLTFTSTAFYLNILPWLNRIPYILQAALFIMAFYYLCRMIKLLRLKTRRVGHVFLTVLFVASAVALTISDYIINRFTAAGVTGFLLCCAALGFMIFLLFRFLDDVGQLL